MTIKTLLLSVSAAAALGFLGCDYGGNSIGPESGAQSSESVQLTTSALVAATGTYRGHTLYANSPDMIPGDYLLSPNGKYKLIMQTDGNLVAYRTWNGTYYWKTGTSFPTTETKYAIASMQADGNFVVYRKEITVAGPPVTHFTLTALWHSRTNGHANARLVLQDDANIVIYWSGGAKGLYR